MSAYGSLLMGLLGIKLINNLKNLNKYKMSYIEFKNNKKQNDTNVYKNWREILNKYYLDNK